MNNTLQILEKNCGGKTGNYGAVACRSEILIYGLQPLQTGTQGIMRCLRLQGLRCSSQGAGGGKMILFWLTWEVMKDLNWS